MKQLSEIYQQCLLDFEATGKRQHPSHLLAMTLLPKKDEFKPCVNTGKFYETYESTIHDSITKIMTDFQLKESDLIQYANDDIFSHDSLLWSVFFDGLWAIQEGIVKYKERTPEQIYCTFFNPPYLEEEHGYHKLVRDNIINIIETSDAIALYRSLNSKEYWNSLLLKDQEELQKIKKASSKEETLCKLADKLEIIKAMANYHGYELDDVLKTADKKRKEAGGYTKKLYLEKTFKTRK